LLVILQKKSAYIFLRKKTYRISVGEINLVNCLFFLE
jgi:hypothetical protein